MSSLQDNAKFTSDELSLSEYHSTWWWREGVLYQIYPRSFCDRSGDGVGDLAGIFEKLDYVESLGVSGVWLNPIYPSPMEDGGYDVAEYCDIDPVFGNLSQFDALLEEMHRRGLRLIMDLVPNHTSDRHPWFRASRSSRSDPKRGYYIWADPAGNGGPPNNWRAAFGGSAWTFDERTGQYYLHSFLPSQPDLDWSNPVVREEILDVMRFWLDRGIDGFRIDVVHMLAKDPELRDDPPDNPFAHFLKRPEVHDYVKQMRRVVDAYEGTVLVGETFLLDIDDIVAFYGNGDDELHLAFCFPLALCGWNGHYMASVVRKTLDALPRGARPCFMFSNHDLPRHPLRYGSMSIRPAALLLLALPGTPFLYMGEELGMTGVLPPGYTPLDPGGRDGPRTPFRWDASPTVGFCAAGVDPWMPPGNEIEGTDVAAQDSDPSSVLNLYRRAIAFRKRHPSLREGTYEELVAQPKFWAFRRRGEREQVTVIANMSSESTAVDSGSIGVSGPQTVVVATHLEMEGAIWHPGTRLELPPGSAVYLVPHLPESTSGA